MARIRAIKPDFFTSEDIVSLSPLARLLFISTWLEADREGRFVWRPKTMKLRYLPGIATSRRRQARRVHACTGAWGRYEALKTTMTAGAETPRKYTAACRRAARLAGV